VTTIRLPKNCVWGHRAGELQEADCSTGGSGKFYRELRAGMRAGGDGSQWMRAGLKPLANCSDLWIGDAA